MFNYGKNDIQLKQKMFDRPKINTTGVDTMWNTGRKFPGLLMTIFIVCLLGLMLYKSGYTLSSINHFNVRDAAVPVGTGIRTHTPYIAQEQKPVEIHQQPVQPEPVKQEPVVTNAAPALVVQPEKDETSQRLFGLYHNISEKTANEALAGFFKIEADEKTPFKNLPLEDAQYLFYKLCTRKTAKCERYERFGRPGDGGYEVCMSAPYTLEKNNCIVYSFGIARDWSFDDAIVSRLNCEHHSFDPSIDLKDHNRNNNPKHFFHNMGLWQSDEVNDKGWILKSMESIRRTLGHQDKVIDLMKIDVEGAEWPALKTMLKDGTLAHIKQLIFEIHTPKFKDQHMTTADFADIYNDMNQMKNNWGYHIYLEHHNNGCCGRFATLTPNKFIHGGKCCYELYYLNANFIPEESRPAMLRATGF